MFLELGYEYAEDDGSGIIHPGEKTQSSFSLHQSLIKL